MCLSLTNLNSSRTLRIIQIAHEYHCIYPFFILVPFVSFIFFFITHMLDDWNSSWNAVMPNDDYEKIVEESLNCGVTLYIVKDWNTNDFQNLWRRVFEERKCGLVASSSTQNDIAQQHQVTQKEKNQKSQVSKRKELKIPSPRRRSRD